MIESLENQRAAMRVLYVIFVLCVAALLLTALAAARHIRRHEEKRKAASEEKPLATADMSPHADVLVPVGKVRGN